MATTTKPLYTALSIGCTFGTLTSGSARKSNAVDNTTLLYDDALVSVSGTGSGTPGTGPVLYVYAFASADGTTYTDAITPGDAAYTPNSPSNLRLIGVLNMPAAGTSYVMAPASIALAFGGTMPPKWGLVIVNASGMTLTAGAVQAQGVQYQSV